MIQLHLFGGGELRVGSPGGGRIIGLQPKRLALLAYLAAGGPAWSTRSRDTLLGLFWPELSETRARAALNQAVYRLRRELGADAILSRGEGGLALSPDRIWCDVAAFREALEDGDPEKALRLYRSEFLEGFYLTGHGAFERWADEVRASLARDAAKAAWSLADQARRPADAVAWARRALELGSDLDERGLRRLLELRDRLGNRSGALQDFENFATRLAEKYEAEPAPETVALIERIRERSEAKPADAASGEADTDVAPVAHEAALDLSQRSRRGRMVLAIAAIGAVVLALVGAWAAWPWPGPPEATGGRVAVVPFQYRGAPGLEHTAGAATYLLAANLDGLAGLGTVDPQALAVALDRERGRTPPDQNAARSAAIALGAQYVITGGVTRAGPLVRVSAAMRDREDDGNGVRATAEGPPEELFSLVDRVTANLLAGQRTGPSDAVIRSATLTTESFAALAEFIRGETAYRAGRHASASEAFRRAVDIDSTFALAWMRLSQAQNWIAGTASGPAAREALRHAGRLTAPARRQVEAWYHYREGQVLRAERLHHEMLRYDSASVSAWIALGEIDYHWGPAFGRPPEEARSRWERALTLDPANVGVMLHLARIAARERRGRDFDDLENEILRLTPPIETKVELSAIRAFTFGTPEERESVVEEFRQLPQAARWSVTRSVASVARSLADVDELLTLGAPGSQSRAISQRDAINGAHRAGMLLAAGRLSRADALLDTVTTGDPNRILAFRAASGLVPLVGSGPERLADLGARIAALPGASVTGADPPHHLFLYLRGALAARVGRHVEAIAIADALEARDGAVGQMDALRLAGLVRAISLRERGRSEDALAALVEPTRRSPPRLPMIWMQDRAAERFLRAELLAETGRPREALRWFATFPDPTSFDVLYLPAAELRQAELLFRLGQPDAAMSHLERLETLWQDADPGAARTLEQVIAKVVENPGEGRW